MKFVLSKFTFAISSPNFYVLVHQNLCLYLGFGKSKFYSIFDKCKLQFHHPFLLLEYNLCINLSNRDFFRISSTNLFKRIVLRTSLNFNFVLPVELPTTTLIDSQPFGSDDNRIRTHTLSSSLILIETN